MKNMLRFCTGCPITACCIVFFSLTATGQEKSYLPLNDFLTTRIYSNIRSNTISFPAGGSPKELLRYNTGTAVSLGAGITWRQLNLNMSYGFPFLNNPISRAEKPRQFDFQFHIYGRKKIIDLYLQDYRGFQRQPMDPRTEPALYRHDIRFRTFSLNLERILNPERFSMRAPMIQTEMQVKSAGSLLVGFASQVSELSADSAVGTRFPDFSTAKGFRRFRQLAVAPSAGYAFTWVPSKHIFLMGSLSWQPTLFFSGAHYPGGSTTQLRFDSRLFIRSAAGLQFNAWTAAASWINHQQSGFGDTQPFSFVSGLLRISVAYRFVPDAKSRQWLDLIFPSGAPGK